jgi:hypothetical protein
MSAVKPFKKLIEAFRNKIATRKWTHAYVNRRLAALNLTGKGVKITPTGENHLHFEVLDSGAGGDCAFPFKVAIATDGYMTVTSGDVRMENSAPVVPILAGTGLRLNAATPPRRLIPVFNGLGYVLLKVKHEPVLGTFRLGSYSVLHLAGGRLLEDPTIAVVSTIPPQVVATIDWATGAITPGERYVKLATLTGNGTASTLVQEWWGNMHVVVTGTGDTQLNIGG